MTEARFAYDTGTEPVGLRLADCGINDARLAIVDDLEIPALDESYVAVFQSWQALRVDWVDAKVALDSAQQKRAMREAEVRKGTHPDEYKASSAAERKAKFDNIVEVDRYYQEVQAQVLTCKWDCEKIVASIEDAEKEMAHIKARLNWRTFMLRFLGTVTPVPVQKMGL